MSEERSGRALTINIGKTNTGEHWIVLADSDSTDTWPLAQFVDEEAMNAYVLWMGTQGYTSVKLPSQDELDEFFQ